jgi:hypothetical protein
MLRSSFLTLAYSQRVYEVNQRAIRNDEVFADAGGYQVAPTYVLKKCLGSSMDEFCRIS